MKTRMVLSILTFAVLFLVLPLSAQLPDRSKPPVLGPPPTMKLPAIQKLTLSNGIPVIVFEKHSVPLMQLDLIIRAGSVNESDDQLGLANLTAAMMREGAGEKSSLELAEAIDFLGVTIRSFTGAHVSVVSLSSTMSKFDEAYKLFSDIALHPSFPAQELVRLRKERLTSLMQMYDQPTAIAATASAKLLFGEKHPYGRGASGTEKTLKSFTIEDVKKFYTTYYRANNAAIVVVGDVKPADIIQKLEKEFSSWAKGEIPEVKVKPADQVSDRIVYLIDKPDAPQSVIRISRIGAARITDDYFPLIVMNSILGGSFSSRLNINLREKHGYTYGAYSGFEFRPVPGAFTALSSVQTAVTDKAMTEFMNELNGILQPVSDDELQRAKNLLALGYPNNFQGVGQIASQLDDMVIYNLPDDYFNQYIQKVLAVTKDDVSRVTKKYIDPNALSIVVVGDRKSIEKGLKDLNLGKMKNMKIEDVLGKMPTL
jgi:zinc protease